LNSQTRRLPPQITKKLLLKREKMRLMTFVMP
jgi:hypothetical protein